MRRKSKIWLSIFSIGSVISLGLGLTIGLVSSKKFKNNYVPVEPHEYFDYLTSYRINPNTVNNPNDWLDDNIERFIYDEDSVALHKTDEDSDMGAYDYIKDEGFLRASHERNDACIKELNRENDYISRPRLKTSFNNFEIDNNFIRKTINIDNLKHVNEIRNFVNNYLKTRIAPQLGDLARVPGNKNIYSRRSEIYPNLEKGKYVIYHAGGPYYRLYETLKFLDDENIYAIFSTQAQYDFYPRALFGIGTPFCWKWRNRADQLPHLGKDFIYYSEVMNHEDNIEKKYASYSEEDIEKMWKVVEGKNSADLVASYKELFNNKTINNYELENLMMGDLSLSAPEHFEISSFGFTIINAIREERLLSLIPEGSEINGVGFSYGMTNLAENLTYSDILIKKYTNILLMDNLLSNTVRYATFGSGGVYPDPNSMYGYKEWRGKDGLEGIFMGGGDFVVGAYKFLHISYSKYKYGLIRRLQERFEDKDILKSWQDKVNISIGKRDLDVIGYPTPYEVKFYLDNGINYHAHDDAHSAYHDEIINEFIKNKTLSY